MAAPYTIRAFFVYSHSIHRCYMLRLSRMVTKTKELPVTFSPQNTREIDYEKDLGAPGEFPYTRGIYKNMYRGRLWTMRQYAGYATAEESNARYKYLLAHGTTGLSVAFDLPTQIGLDSDDPLAAGEIGKVGVAIDSLEDMQRR
jgi:methylmalonyl-CoA mutase N-terminal domain/subunit